MRQVKNLFVLVGFSGDVNQPISELKSVFHDTAADFIGRTYPERTAKRALHVPETARDVVDYVFGSQGAASFCRRTDQPCAAATERSTARNCDHARGSYACFRARPRMIIIVTHRRTFSECFDRLGRACLLLTFDGDEGLNAEKVAQFIRGHLADIDRAAEYLYNLPLNDMVGLLPRQNFQLISGKDIAGDAQRQLPAFRQVMQRYHSSLFDSNFINPVRKYMRGAYKLNGRIGFQRDRLHDQAQFGSGSRADLFHLINAHHLFGAAYVPGRHFDVSAEDGRALRQRFKDILSGMPSKTGSEHENITPCDRVLKAL